MLQTITQASANAGILASTGYSLTGSDATSMVSLVGTLNTSGVPSVFKLAVTVTATGASTPLLSILGGAAGATGLFRVLSGGQVDVLSGQAFNTVMGSNVVGIRSRDGSALDFSVTGVNQLELVDANELRAVSTLGYGWSSSSVSAAGSDTKLSRNAAGVVEVNNGTAGTFRDLKVRDIIINGATNLLKTSAALTDNAGVSGGTLLNAPAAGNPTKWCRVDDNGTARFIPMW